ncbi:hypothetical protein EVJ58_g7793 [Rhodofomes roseus]|uniref:Uncharacterized protein n=1 Tax=Rhodofomes roseus TaxID=34475 RepID=A0A4Y9Y2N3_9APHY|nr:hypothetical protein EVJ58_g7793 [Rhodofomes roseus]
MSRIAIVTGAAQGIARATGLGGQLRIDDMGRCALAVDCDVTEEKDVVAMIDKSVETFGGLDVMVANAGILMVKPMFDTSVDDLNTILSINVRGVMLCYKYAAMQMVKQDRDGRIIGAHRPSKRPVSSDTEPRVSFAGVQNLSAYCASKFAVRGLTQAYVFHPDDEKNGGPASTGKLAVEVPLDTPDAQPTVIADFVSYLIRPESYHITGQSVNINGGMLYD